MNKTFAVFHCNYGLVITGEDTIAEASVSAMVCECCLAPAARYKLTAVLYCRGLLLAFQTATKVFAGWRRRFIARLCDAISGEGWEGSEPWSAPSSAVTQLSLRTGTVFPKPFSGGTKLCCGSCLVLSIGRLPSAVWNCLSSAGVLRGDGREVSRAGCR